eukprot:GHRR01025229.1.p1 GENE.GHRR01025229.1~~GHRR01025229.1.p1  ORF type:complete len:158 (+),score=38.97 GHRR01025229.1:22-495(+)
MPCSFVLLSLSVAVSFSLYCCSAGLDQTNASCTSWQHDQLLVKCVARSHCCCCCCATGANLLWGGKPLTGHGIPECYGALEPTAVFVPLDAMKDPAAFELVTTEVFGPFQVITEYTGEDTFGDELQYKGSSDQDAVDWWSECHSVVGQAGSAVCAAS